MTAAIAADRVTRTYPLDGELGVTALRGVDLRIDAGEYVAIVGPSGSGKSTLMHLLGGLDRPTSGRLSIGGRDVASLSPGEMARLRNEVIGFVFQSFHLLPRTSAADNVALPLVYRGLGARERRRLAGATLERVGLGHRLGHRPNQLSGGEQQRVAIARALVTDPQVLLADEPTGNLDTVTGQAVLALLEELNAERGVALVIVTHDRDVAARARRRVVMRDGLVVSDDGAAGSGAGFADGAAGSGAGSADGVAGSGAGSADGAAGSGAGRNGPEIGRRSGPGAGPDGGAS